MSNKRRHTELVGVDEILRVSADSGTIRDRWGNALTLTDMDTFYYGGLRCMEFDGANSKVDAGAPDTLVGDKTIAVWVYPKSIGENNAGIVVTNDQFELAITTLNRLRFTGDLYGNTATSAIGAAIYNKWVHVIITRTSAGVANFYINGSTNGTADQSSGTPVAGNNIIIGARTGGARTWDGFIEPLVIFDQLLTAQQISQIHTYTKKWYQQ